MFCAFEGVGAGDGPERRARLLWYEDGARVDVCSRGEAVIVRALEGNGRS